MADEKTTTTKKATKKSEKKIGYKEILSLKGDLMKRRIEENAKDQPDFTEIRKIRKQIARALTKLNSEKN